MADFFMRIKNNGFIINQDKREASVAGPDANIGAFISGRQGTYQVHSDGRDAIAALGYACNIDEASEKESLTKTLKLPYKNHHVEIGNIKKKYAGQFAVLIKKNNFLYILADFMGCRNIFYAEDGSVFSSSFSQIEKVCSNGSSSLDEFKVFEYLAMRHLLYPAWIGKGTENKKIKWLRPNEYIVIDLRKMSYRVERISYSLDNRKETDCTALSIRLTEMLTHVLNRKEFFDSTVSASVTGGRDSRLVATVATRIFKNMRYRTAVSDGIYNSMKDLEVAKKISNRAGVPLDVYPFESPAHNKRFEEFTEGIAPSYNHAITPLIENASKYALGFGGVFGSELFMPVPFASIKEFIDGKIAQARSCLHVSENFWRSFRESLNEEFKIIKHNYLLSEDCDQDYIRIFMLMDTARYGSFIISAYNIGGNELEPYGSYDLFCLAMKVHPSLWGHAKSLNGTALVQKNAMAILSKPVASILTFDTYRPMLPLSAATMPLYLMGYSLNVKNWLRMKYVEKSRKPSRTVMPNGYYVSDGWEKQFMDRTANKYQYPVMHDYYVHG